MGIELASDWHVLTAILAVLLLCAAVWFSYRRNLDALVRRKAVLLLCLRLGVVIFLFLCILKPVISYRSIAGEKTRLVFLVDNSQSMTLPVKGPRGEELRIDAARKLASGPESLVEPLSRSFSVQTFVFSGSATQMPPGEIAKALDGSGNVTALVGSLREAAAKSGSTAPTAAVVITDGADNSAAVASGQALGFAVFTVGVGSRLSESGLVDLVVGAPQAPEEAYKDTTVQIEVEIGASGLENATVIPVTLSGPEGEMLAAGEVNLSPEKPREKLTLAFISDSPGIFEYTVSVPERQDEHIKENNRQSFTLHVLDSKLRVLLVDRVRWEYKYLKMVLEQDPNIQFTGAVLTQKNQFTLQGAGQAELVARGLPIDVSGYEKWDVVILGELERDSFALQQFEALKQFVSKGGGFCALGGRSSLGQGGYGGTPVEEILPVELSRQAAGMRGGTFVMQLTQEGRAHPLMQGTARFFEGGKEVACELDGINITGKPKPGATVIAQHPDLSSEGTPLSVVSVQRYGEGKTMVVAGSTTYKWHLKHRGLGLDSPHVRFWGQAVRWLAGAKEQDTGGIFAIWTDRRNYTPGQKVLVSARLDAEQAASPLPEMITVRITHDSSAEEAHLRPRGDGRHYEGEFLPGSGGQYEIGASIVDAEGKAVQKTVEIAVGRRYLEFEEPDLNDELLRRISAESGGRYYASHEASKLIRDIEAIASAHSEEKEVSIWDTPLFFLLFIGLATAEWILRKRNMLI